MSTVTNDADEIRRRMAAIRRELHEDVREVVATAEAATDWKRYLTMYPWASLGAAFALGYWIVPRKRRAQVSLAGVATQADLSRVRDAVESTRQTVAESVKGHDVEAKTERKKGLIGAAFAMLAPLAWRTIQGYGMKYLEQWIMQQQWQAMQAGPHPDQPGPRAAQSPFPGSAPGYGPGPQGGAGGTRPGGPRRAGGPGMF